ncbi:MAG: MFS transporter [Fibrobacteres bacterium]|nr:MFS transporter [Fibrobacterota bacterium]
MSKPEELRPDQLNAEGQVTDTAVLHKARVRIGVGNVLYVAEESSLGAITTVILRHLGGNAFHLGLFGATSGFATLFQWIGALLLKKFNSNKRAMVAALLLASAVSALIAAVIALPAFWPAFKPFAIWSFLILCVLFTATAGALRNIETSWIGDLVPENRRGWFASFKWIVYVITGIFFSFLFSRIADLWPGTPTYAGFYVAFVVSFLVVIPIISGIVDRIPKHANFVSGGSSHHERLNYKDPAFVLYLLYTSFWLGGRQLIFTFSAAYMMDQFGFSLTKLLFVQLGQPVVSIFALFFLGKLTDRTGNRGPVLIISFILLFSMSLWISTAWLGFVPIVIYYVLASLGGATGGLLGNNYALELFPAKGRAGYLAFAGLVNGIVGIICIVGAGVVMRHLDGWSMMLWGAKINNYHVLFTMSITIASLALVPLILIGKRRVTES